MTPETADAQSPHHSADAITTPMLIIHGDKDYRVPITEATRLWWDFSSRTKADTTTPHKFLHFPDEGHWILAPTTPSSGTPPSSPSFPTTSSTPPGPAPPSSADPAPAYPKSRHT